MAGMFGGILQLVMAVILVVNVLVPTIKNANTTGWTASERLKESSFKPEYSSLQPSNFGRYLWIGEWDCQPLRFRLLEGGGKAWT